MPVNIKGIRAAIFSSVLALLVLGVTVTGCGRLKKSAMNSSTLPEQSVPNGAASGSPSNGGAVTDGGPVSGKMDCTRVTDSRLKVIEVSLPDAGRSGFPQTSFYPEPNVVYAFSFTAPADVANWTRSFVETKMTQTVGTKTVVISQCIGDVTGEGIDPGCRKTATESARLNAYARHAGSTLSPNYWCALTPGMKYYVNVNSINPSGTASTCSSSVNCAFTFQAN